jgi:hypothetical protein
MTKAAATSTYDVLNAAALLHHKCTATVTRARELHKSSESVEQRSAAFTVLRSKMSSQEAQAQRTVT